jgi:chromosomal replication initiator protein
MYLLRKYTDLNYIDIARLLNRKDHTTIMHGVEKIEEEIQNNSSNITSNISELKEIIFKK